MIILITFLAIIFCTMLIYVTGWLHGYNKAHSKSLCPTCRNKTKKLVENMNDWRLEKFKNRKEWKK